MTNLIRRRTLKLVVRKTMATVVALFTVVNVTTVGLLVAPKVASADFGSGAIWTTNESCANPAAQDDNEYAVAEHVHIRGENFDPNFTLYFAITGQPGHASADPNVVVATGSTQTDGDGYFCVDAYTIPSDDDGTYTVDVDETVDLHSPMKNDNYHVNGTTLGALAVHKLADTDGNGSFEVVIDSEGGFAWQVSDDDTWHFFGTSVELPAGDYDVWENSISGYHMVGWTYGSPAQFEGNICEDSELNDASTVPVSVSNNETTEVTFCNAANTFNVEVLKIVDPLFGGPQVLSSEHPWTWSTGSITKHSQESTTLFAGINNVITETPEMFQAPDWSASWKCDRIVGEGSFTVGAGNGRSFNPQTDFSDAPEHGQSYVCEFWNTELGALHGQKWSDLNSNGIWDNGEPALNGWTVYLDANDNGQKDDGEQSMVTQAHDDGIPANDDNGWYWFEGLEAGTYKICEVQQGGWNQTYPLNGNDNCHTMHVGFASQDVAQTCNSQETLNAVFAPSCNFGNYARPNLTISKTDNHVTAQPGETLTYEVTVTNTGGAAFNVKVDDTLPSFLSVPMDISDGGVYAAGHVVWNVATIAANSSKTLTFKATINASMPVGTTVLHNVADLGCSAIVSIDSIMSIQAVACLFSGQATDDTSVTVPQVLGDTNPDLSIEKSVVESTLNPNGIAHYTIVVKNIGDGDAVDVVLKDILPAGLSFLYTPGNSLSWNLGTMTPGETETIHVQARVDADAERGDYTNTAIVTATDVPTHQAQATINVVIPEVLGLATTGAGPRDYFIFVLGALMIIAGFALVRSRQTVLAPVRK